jgi:hypothetical protein
MKKFAISGLIVIFAFTFVTCRPELPPEGGEDDVEYTDVEYEIYGGVGNERVKSVKLYLDGKVVPVTAKQRAIHRALSLESAGASHDFFEVVFRNAGGTQIARSTWDIGSPARVTNVAKSVNYTGLNPTGASSTVFVGKKTNKTLLGVGFLLYVDDDWASATNMVVAGTESVTFMVAPLKTWLGFIGTTADVKGRDSWFGGDPPPPYTDTNTGAFATFLTNAGTPGAGNAPARSATLGGNTSLMSGNITNPIFKLPPYDGSVAGNNIMRANYKIGGLEGLTAARVQLTIPAPGGTPAFVVPTSVWPAVRIYGVRSGGTPRGGLQVIKRKPTFEFQGVKYEAGNIYDSDTEVVVDSTYYTSQTHLAPFTNEIPLTFTVKSGTAGVFAITFQAPVMALTDVVTNAVSGSTDSPDSAKPVKWFVRPADGPNLYLLDDGKNDGGMVLLGDVSTLDEDWIRVITTGIGFDND